MKSIALIYLERLDEALECLEILIKKDADTQYNKSINVFNQGIVYFYKKNYNQAGLIPITFFN